MGKYKVVLTDNIFPDLILERDMLDKVDADLIECKSREDLNKECVDADAVINTYVQLTPDIIESMEKCKLIIRNGIGVNTIDVDTCNKKGIMVANIPTYCLDEVAIHAITLMLSIGRKITLLNDSVKSGTWDVKVSMPVFSFQNKVLGLVGFGRIPREVCKKAIAFGLKVIAYDPFITKEMAEELGAEKVEIDELIEKSDYISIHCPLTSDTKGMFNYEAFKKMKDTAYIINTARGPIINEEELIKALQDKLIAGAALDVLTKDEVDVNNPLLAMNNVIVTPHAAWYSEESILRRRTDTVESVVMVLEGKEPASFLNKKQLNG